MLAIFWSMKCFSCLYVVHDIFWQAITCCIIKFFFSKTLELVSRKLLLYYFPLSFIAYFFQQFLTWRSFDFLFFFCKIAQTPPCPSLKKYDLSLILLTILTEVIHNNNSTQQFRWRSVDYTVYSAKEDRQSLLVEANYDSGSWQLGWICVMFGFTTV